MKGVLTFIQAKSKKKEVKTFTPGNQMFNNASYIWDPSFNKDKDPTPKELLAAAHAGCFATQLGFILNGVGYTPEEITAASTLTFIGNNITESRLVIKVKVPDIDKEYLMKYVEKAKKECPISKILNMKIYIDATVEPLTKTKIK